MSVRLVRRRTRMIAFSAVALAATLSLTACENGQGSQDAGPASTSKPTTDNKPSEGSKPGEGGTGTGTANKPSAGTHTGASNGSGGTGGSGSGSTTDKGPDKGTGKDAGKGKGDSDPNASENRAVCDSSRVKITAQVVDRPLNTMILTATNTGSKLCDLFYSPVVRFEDAQSVPPAMEETRPQAVVSIQPGQKAYAAVKLSKSDAKDEAGYTANSLDVGFYDRNNKNLDAFARVSLPSAGVYIDSSVKVSFWQSDLDSVTSL
jgi:hypothetical protein